MATNTTKTSVEDILSNNKMGTPSENIDNLTKTVPTGQISTAIGNSFFGINHRQTPAPIQINKDYFGLTFFTRPNLNLTTENIRAARLLAPLLSKEEASVQRIIRCMLDSTLARKGFNSPVVDNQQAFIPILTNHLVSMAGWPDVIVPTMTSPPGIYQESFSFADGVTANYSTYDIQANFRNIPGDPITTLFFYWMHYQSLVYQGIIVPYPDYIVQNEIDYMTRIYRLTLDTTKQRVTKIAACGAAYPISAPVGASFNFESDRPINSAMHDQISISFRCTGAMYQDDILISEFNRTTAIFNRALEDSNFKITKSEKVQNPLTGAYETVPVFTNDHYTKLAAKELGLFNNRGYPRINPYSYELEWWVDNNDYKYIMSLPNNPLNSTTESTNTRKSTSLGQQAFNIPDYTKPQPDLSIIDQGALANLDPASIDLGPLGQQTA
jgi:hypothetical protein